MCDSLKDFFHQKETSALNFALVLGCLDCSLCGPQTEKCVHLGPTYFTAHYMNCSADDDHSIRLEHGQCSPVLVEVK